VPDCREVARIGERGVGMPWSFSGVCNICDIGRGELSVRRRFIGGGVGNDFGGIFWLWF
jgi:hypothetical protein